MHFIVIEVLGLSTSLSNFLSSKRCSQPMREGNLLKHSKFYGGVVEI